MNYKNRIKGVMAASPFIRGLCTWMLPDYPKIFVYHRFAPPGVAIPHRVSQDVFAWQLDQISRRNNVLTLEGCVSYFLEKRRWPERAVVLTIDDGYADFYEYAYPELRRRGLGATFFVTTNFIDRKIWLWPDRIEYAVNNTRKDVVTIALTSDSIKLPLATAPQRDFATKTLTNHCKALPDDSRKAFINALKTTLEVDLPAVPPPAFQSATWTQLADMQENGIEIGSHTMNHPILSMLEYGNLEEEILKSKDVIKSHLGNEVRSFCYPNSSEPDINKAVLYMVRTAGYSSAVFGTNLKRWDLYRLPRLGLSNDRSDFLWKLAGLEGYSLVANFRSKKLTT
jgi:peptidoglycan/xylan/chitin deacetylase (PgdA/CDA1 family)